MTKRVLSILQYVIFLGLGIFLIWWQFKDMTAVQRTQFRESFANAEYWIIVPIVLMSLLSHLSRSVRWKILMEPMGYKPSLKNTFAATMVGYLANSAVPRLGEILKCTFLGRYEKIPADKLIGTILVERIFDLFCYAIFIAITILIQVDVVGSFVKDKFGQIANKKGLPLWAILTMVVVTLLVFLYLFRWLIRKYPENRFVKKIRGVSSGIKEGFLTIRHLKNKGWFLAHTMFIWSMYLLQVYLGFSAMQHTSGLGMAAACSVLTLSTLAMIITPNGLGAFPAGIQMVLLLYNIDDQSFGWLMWGVSTAIMVIVGFICLLALPYMNRKHPEVSIIPDNAFPKPE